MSDRLLLSLLLLAPAVTACTAVGFRASPDSVSCPAAESSLPVSWQGDLVLADITVDGIGPYRFVLDTGSSVSIVSEAVALAHPGGVSYFERSVALDVPGGEALEIERVVRANSVRLGPVEWRGLDALVVPLDEMSRAMGVRVDGVLGASMFARGVLILDYPRREVRYATSGGVPPVETIAFPMVAEPLPVVPCEILGRVIPVVIDSGSNGGIRLAEWPAAAQFIWGPIRGNAFVGMGGRQSDESSGRLFGDAVLGPVRVRNPHVAVGKGRSRIGVAILRDFRVTLDFALGNVELRGDGRPVGTGALSWTGVIIGGRGAGVFVERVVQCSSGDSAGVKANDELLSVDGMRADASAVSELRERLQGRTRVVHLVLRRDGRELEVQVPIVESGAME